VTGSFQDPIHLVVRRIALLGAFALPGCLREPDPGGQEGEERWPRQDNDVSGGEGEGEGEDDTGEELGHPEGLEGERLHLRGAGAPGEFDCELVWEVSGERVDGVCDDCVYTFDLDFALDAEESHRREGACSDVYGDEAATVGILADYYGYGPVVVGFDPLSGDPYMLGRASIDDDHISWRYGYVDESWGYDDGWYYTWYWSVEAELE